MTTRTKDSLKQAEASRSAPFTVTLTDGSYIQWDKKDGLFRVAYYQRKAIKEHDLRSAISLAMKKKMYSVQMDEIMRWIESRPEYEGLLNA